MDRRGKCLNKVTAAVKILQHGKSLPSRYKAHPLKGRLAGFCECHIEPDWLLIYVVEEDAVALYSTGQHTEVFMGM